MNAAMSGNLGGGREGVMRSEYQNKFRYEESIAYNQECYNKDLIKLNKANTAFGQQGQLMAGANTLGADQQRMASTSTRIIWIKMFQHYNSRYRPTSTRTKYT